jgi:hypothetical protein
MSCAFRAPPNDGRVLYLFEIEEGKEEDEEEEETK